MRKLVIAAFAALAMFGCTRASDTVSTTSGPPPPAVQTTPTTTTPAPRPVTDAEKCACKNDWAKAWAKEHGTTVAAAERYARSISTEPPTTLHIYGKDFVFSKHTLGATVWSTCGKAIEDERKAARVSVTAPARTVYSQAEFDQQFRLAHYPTLDPETGLVVYHLERDRADIAEATNTELKRQLKDRRTPWFEFGVIGLLCFFFGWLTRFMGRKEARPLRNRDLPRVDPRPVPSEPQPDSKGPTSFPEDFTGQTRE